MGKIFRRREDGANLVEFALLAPFLLLLLFGMIEFAWLFSQNLDVRHGAREGARLAAVNYPVGPTSTPPTRTDAQRDQLVAEICARMDLSSGGLISLNSTGAVGDAATAKVDAPANTLTGFIDWAIPAGTRLVSEVDIRLEQSAGWSNGNDLACP